MGKVLIKTRGRRVLDKVTDLYSSLVLSVLGTFRSVLNVRSSLYISYLCMYILFILQSKPVTLLLFISSCSIIPYYKFGYCYTFSHKVLTPRSRYHDHGSTCTGISGELFVLVLPRTDPPPPTPPSIRYYSLNLKKPPWTHYFSVLS